VNNTNARKYIIKYSFVSYHNKKFALMLTKGVKAYSSSGSVV